MKATQPLELNRRSVVASIFACALVLPRHAYAATGTPMDVWTGPGCGCCHEWVAHLQANGFAVTTHDGGNVDARKRLGMPTDYASCHTGGVGGYAIEGHVPATEIRRLLEERPDAIGLSVPSMPIGSPGMDGPVYGGVQDPYDVLLIKRDGGSTVYRSYRSGPAPAAERQATVHRAEGVLKAIDLSTRTVSISHGAIPAVGWPAMTMSFALADPNVAAGFAPDQKVTFHFTVEGGMSATVTQLATAP